MKRRPYGTPVLFFYRSFPALKRWANIHCASGAGFVEAVSVRKRSVKPFEGPPTVKPPALPDDFYSFSFPLLNLGISLPLLRVMRPAAA
jgi:hypothetical protein